jgi:hypothetical protein
MAITAYPVALAKRTVVTLTSGTSWTVPAGVIYVNATLFGAGQAGGAPALAGGVDYGQRGIVGNGGQVISTFVSTTPGASISYAIGAGGTASTAINGASGGTTTFTGATSATGGSGVGAVGQSANNGGAAGVFTGTPVAGGNGGAGKIEIEYWSY